MSYQARPFQLLTIAALVYSTTRAAFAWSELPTIMASHFGAGGVPDAFMSKGQFFSVFAATVIVTLSSLIGSVLLMHKIPEKYLNLPHKEYWLQKDRMPEARRRMASAMWAMTAATTLLFAVTLELVVSANLARRNLDNQIMWLTLGAFMIFTLLWIVKIVLSFSPPNESN